MKQKLKTGGMYILQIFLTALASALIAMLQNYLSAHAGVPGGQINPNDTGAIGGVLSSGHIAYKSFKSKFIF
jgi:hypothetical protein